MKQQHSNTKKNLLGNIKKPTVSYFAKVAARYGVTHSFAVLLGNIFFKGASANVMKF
jgi:hypothetical protein